MIRKNALVTVAVLAVLGALDAPRALAQQGGKPVSAKLLQGRRLVLDEQNISVETPRGDRRGEWQWYELDSHDPYSTLHACTRTGDLPSENVIIFLNVEHGETRRTINQEFAQDLVLDLVNGARFRGSIASKNIELTDFPTPGSSCHIAYETVIKDTGFHGSIYATVSSKKLVIVQCLYRCDKEPPELAAFVESLQVRVPEKSARPAAVSPVKNEVTPAPPAPSDDDATRSDDGHVSAIVMFGIVNAIAGIVGACVFAFSRLGRRAATPRVARVRREISFEPRRAVVERRRPN